MSKKKKTYYVPPDLQMNPLTSSWFSAPLYANDTEYPMSQGASWDINMPIHPEYISALQPKIKIGDLVETYQGDIGIVVGQRKPEGMFITIKNANNMYYTVLINEKEKKYIGYSLKKIKK
jgi:hypothetical protein